MITSTTKLQGDSFMSAAWYLPILLGCSCSSGAEAKLLLPECQSPRNSRARSDSVCKLIVGVLVFKEAERPAEMAEAHQTRVQKVVEEMVQSLEKDHIRKMQGRMFRCSADCCDRPSDSMTQVHQCIERCHTPLAQAQGLVTSELEKFQVRSALQTFISTLPSTPTTDLQ
ncbi:hypothetical protein GOODEAATRI_027426 [Goodea atripinnis]|uniref:Protein FAM136A n=1 Tax=Goodea atripinnis TaxID=208336 RepID=A0ABV0P0Z1_9TELE